MAYFITPLTLMALTAVLVYGYTAIPDASDAVSRLLSSKGESTNQKAVSAETGSEHSLVDKVVNYKLGHPGVSKFAYIFCKALAQYHDTNPAPVLYRFSVIN